MSAQIIALGFQICPHPGCHNFYMGLYRENFRNLPVPSHKASAYQNLHEALSGGHKFYIGLYREKFRNLLEPSHKA